MVALDLSNPQSIRAIMANHGIRPRHRLGQNFLVDGRVLDEILEASGVTPTDLVLEIGPGLGVLTQRLAQRGAQVVAIELDRTMVEILKRTVHDQHANVELIHGDALTIDFQALLAERLPPGGKAKIAANLPYYITTPLVMRLIEGDLPLSQIVVMVQKEVADRMVSAPGGKNYGALSVAVQYYTEPRLVRVVGRNAFFPAPEVDSAVVALNCRQRPPVSASKPRFFQVVRAAFGQRRKTLANALMAGLNLERLQVQEILGQVGIDPLRRGETLSLEEFAGIARTLDSMKSGMIE